MFDFKHWPMWIRLIFWRLPRFLWWLLGVCVPLGSAKTPGMQKRVYIRLRSLENIKDVLSSDEFKEIYILSGFDVKEEKEISRSEALGVIRNLKLDYNLRAHFFRGIAQQNAMDLKSLVLVHRYDDCSISVFVNLYQGINSEFDDISVNDEVSLVIQKGIEGEYVTDFPVFIYNHATNTLINCDVWDLQLGLNGVKLPHKGQKLTSQAKALILNLKEKNQIVPSVETRVANHLHSHDEPPRVEVSNWRDIHRTIFAVVVLALVAYGLFCGVLWLLHK